MTNAAPTINAIPTEFKGMLYRSRLEARWAMFFDRLAIPYEYEPEGYDVGGRWYLPDFWLPDQDCFWEVKPTREHDGGLMQAFVTLVRKDIYVCAGKPTSASPDIDGDELDIAPEVYYAPTWDPFSKEDVGGWDNHQLWCACPACGRLGIKFEAKGGRICRGRCKADEDACGRYYEIFEAAHDAMSHQFTTRTSPR